MYASPISLQQACIDCVTNNLTNLSQSVHQGERNNGPVAKLVFRDPDTFFHTEISELLLSALCDRGKLTDLNISLFDSKHTRLRLNRTWMNISCGVYVMSDVEKILGNLAWYLGFMYNHNLDIVKVRLHKAKALTRRGLRTLRGHSIYELEATGLNITVNDLVLCLGDWSLQNLKSLNVSKCSFLELDNTKYCVVVALSKLHSLHKLNVSCTEFNSHGLGIVCEDLPNLEVLDISNTSVDDITPLRRCKNRLKSLTLYNLKISNDAVIPVLLDLKELRVLDWSDDKDSTAFDIFSAVKARIGHLLTAKDRLPHLVYLDISGKEDIHVKDLAVFLDNHPAACFLGLLYSDACFADRFVDTRHRDFNPGLTVTGIATETQILDALQRYSNRPQYVQKSLYNLFRLTPDYANTTRVDMIKLVLKGMGSHPTQFGVQMAATACLYNLTKGELAERIHPTILREVVNHTLTAMENFPNHYQMQKNTLLTLCCDRILQYVPFDRFRCAKLVFSCLCNFDDPSMIRMSVAISSILAAKICTYETHMLGSHPMYIRKLLDIVRVKVANQTLDSTIKYTLSTLWNLTDESPSTCKVFLDEGGMPLFVTVLEVFEGECDVETKVLGLVNNIAEVRELRRYLMYPQYLFLLRRLLLNSDHVDVSFFAAAIIAHLASDGINAWTVEEIDRYHILEELASVISHWGIPEGEMVTYRSFHSFFPLLQSYGTYQVQLWAAWAIRHVCSKNPVKYCTMLVEENGIQIVKTLSTNYHIHPKVRYLCQAILEELKFRP